MGGIFLVTPGRGDNLTRDNLMKQAANLRDVRVGLLLPASPINASATDYCVVTYMQLQRINGANWDDVKQISLASQLSSW